MEDEITDGEEIPRDRRKDRIEFAECEEEEKAKIKEDRDEDEGFAMSHIPDPTQSKRDRRMDRNGHSEESEAVRGEFGEFET